MLFSRKDVISIIIPIIIEQFLAITVGMADSIMVASAGEAVVSGVSLVDTVNLLMIYVFTALAAGGGVITSQFIGKNDIVSARKSAKQLYFICLYVSVIIMAICVVFRAQILKLVFGSLDSDVFLSAKVYFLFTALSYPFVAIINSCGAILRSMGNTKTTMYSSLLTNALNISGNAILIFVFKMGAAGAAIATLFARMVGAVVLSYLVSDKHKLVYVDGYAKYKPDFGIIKSILHIGVPNGIENSMFQLGKVLTQSLVASFGTVAIAANAVSSSLSTFQYVSGTAMGIAMITIVGRCVGAGEKEQARKYTKNLMAMTYLFIIVISFVMTVFSDQLISLYNLSPQAAKIAKDLMFYHSICVSTIWPFAFTLTNAFRAASDVRYPLIMSMISMWIFRVGFSFILAKYFNLGVYGVWYAMFIDWFFRACVYFVRFIRGTWLTKYTSTK